MKFNKLAKYLDKLENTASRISITEILADLFDKTSGGEIDKVIYLLLGSLAPSYEGVVFNIADKLMVAALAKAYGIKPSEALEKYKKSGDLGLTAEAFSKAKNSKVKVTEVYKLLRKVADDSGEGSTQRKVDGVAKILSGLDPLSARFVARIPVGKLRLGFSDKTIIDALSWMLFGDKSASKEIEKAYFVLPDVGKLAKSIKKSGLKGLNPTRPVVGIPVLPMLAQRLKSPAEMIAKMRKVAVEPKLDGLRVLIHFKRGKKGFVKTYTRNLSETSWMFPELKNIAKSLKAQEAILDTEAVGLDETTRKLANFQTTMTRRRKHDIGETSKKVGIKFYVFDVLVVDGKGLMDRTYSERRKELSRVIKSNKLFQLIEATKTDSAADIRKLHKKYIAEGMEGVMVKRLDGNYVPGRTGWRWVKMKEEENSLAKLADTVDCVVMGYTRGRGKRAEFGVGQFLAGIRDRGKIKTITKVGTGLTDAQFRELKKRLSKIETTKKPKEYDVPKGLAPDYWVEPKLVVELAADEITKSPKHTSGFALRFPRLVRFRDDKETPTTLTEIKKLSALQ